VYNSTVSLNDELGVVLLVLPHGIGLLRMIACAFNNNLYLMLHSSEEVFARLLMLSSVVSIS
jgi:hypothetical protein